MLGHNGPPLAEKIEAFCRKTQDLAFKMDVTPPHSQHPAMLRAGLPLPRRSSSRPTCSCKTINASESYDLAMRYRSRSSLCNMEALEQVLFRDRFPGLSDRRVGRPKRELDLRSDLGVDGEVRTSTGTRKQDQNGRTQRRGSTLLGIRLFTRNAARCKKILSERTTRSRRRPMPCHTEGKP